MSAGIKFKLGPPASSPLRVPDAHPDSARDQVSRHFRTTRNASRLIAAPLSPEDQTIQSMPDVSPTKWHLAHTTWFFERFLLKSFLSGYKDYNPWFDHLFNSYYYTVGPMHARPYRGMLSRPTVAEIERYRAHVDTHMTDLFANVSGGDWDEVAFLTTIGLHHEQQHQELMLTDIKHVLSLNPMAPAAYRLPPRSVHRAAPMGWHEREGGVQRVGYEGTGFSFDNENPCHEEIVRPHALSSRPITNGEYRDFIEDGGYETVTLWHSDGWSHVQAEGWRHPLYWHKEDGEWFEFTLHGRVPLDMERPVAHISFFEAHAFAAWSGKRLPTEFELERALNEASTCDSNLLATDEWCDQGEAFSPQEPRPSPVSSEDEPIQLYGDVWEWTMSPYTPYPGFAPLDGSLAEYNGKFMCNQFVLKGGSCATPAGHIRASYRNFFPPHSRWQFSGLRLASDCPN